jgi:zinc transport system permease protein
MLEFLITALAAGMGIALVTGPLGAFVVWRKMAYFGDTLAHASLLGVAGGVLLSINTTAAVIVTCMVIAIILVSLQQQKHIASDT